jgi:hypothetical protein
MTERTIQIRIDDRARLMSALLSATNWPDNEQTRLRHRAHVHARNTTKRVAAVADHPAVRTLQSLLDMGTPLEAIYSYALSLSWPELALKTPLPWAPVDWSQQIADFAKKADIVGWWKEEDDLWQRACEQTQHVITKADFYSFFKPFIGDITEQLVFMPSISYPSDNEIGVRLETELVCIAPPRIAWGDNEPWPFDDDAGHVYRGALSQYGRLLMSSYLRKYTTAVAPVAEKPLPVDDPYFESLPTWNDQFTALFVAGAVAIFLEQTINVQEANAYLLMEKKVHGITVLPSVVSVLKRYSQFIDYLPSFSQHLRVTKGIG